ncbi:hypothetical protein JL100_035480 (plasmid) [Skermanella mucosa]|uniref:hypothetical protein n=1 Tax=Skermanella mucosa TaxID=1789672 RepID=UPI00192CE2E9|nr:hypothetical protein [Skermanella mucosa]UEM25358.1 hypothetical protein JL100_035480 [Skermanella mucosa]
MVKIDALGTFAAGRLGTGENRRGSTNQDSRRPLPVKLVKFNALQARIRRKALRTPIVRQSSPACASCFTNAPPIVLATIPDFPSDWSAQA